MDSTIVHDVSINGMKDASGIFGVAEYAKENEVKGDIMRKIVLMILMILMILSITAPCLADYSVYPNGGLVIDLIPEDDLVIFEDGNGLTWSFYGIGDYEVGDLVACIFWDAGTSNIFDDEILDARRIGYIEQFE